jgi:hypothetical protein
MSLATLKKKSAVKYNNMSVNSQGFSLNGTHRLQGYVGQTTQGRYLPGGKMNGPDMKGSGTCCGKYYNLPAESQLIQCLTEDSNIVKKSSLNNTGMLMTKYKWIRRGEPFTTVNLISNQLTSQTFLDTIKKEEALKILEAEKQQLCNTIPAKDCGKCVIPKDSNKVEHLSRSSSQYLAYKQNGCQEFINPRPNPNSKQGTPFSCKNVA